MTAYPLSNPPVRLLFAVNMDRFMQQAMKPFALLGAMVAIVVCALVLQPALTIQIEKQALVWLIDRFESRSGVSPQPDAVDRATAINPQELPSQQASLAHWLSKKYHVAPEPVGALVAEAFDLSQSTKLDPTLILAVVAVESSFNPFAESAVGAQGLMQVMTKVHTEKFEGFGGKLATFDPVSNLRVGVKVLQECIARAGSIPGGLKFYVGAALHSDDGGYSAKVLAEQQRLKLVATGRPVPTSITPTASPAAAPAIKAEESAKAVVVDEKLASANLPRD
jgi:soluble lytic murein transglycosylase-like protein